MEHITTIIVALIGGGFVGLIEFLIRRRDEKNDKTKEIVQKIDTLDAKVDMKFAELKGEMSAMKENEDFRWADNKRSHILKFDDELRTKQKHSLEYFDDILRDIDEYEDFCKEHDKYSNSKAVDAVEHIKKVYRECKDENSFI